jgi:hypothetical protein
MYVITIIITICEMSFERWNWTFELKQYLSYVNQISDTSLPACVYVVCGGEIQRGSRVLHTLIFKKIRNTI